MNDDEIEFVRCEICGGSESSDFFADLNWKVVKCRNCGLMFLNPRPHPEHLSAFYTGEYFDDCVAYNPDQSQTVSEFYPIIDEIEKRTRKKGTILDLGCGKGFFLAAAQSKGWDAMGVDISRDGVFFACNTFKVNAIQADPAYWHTDVKFDFVVAFHSIEHFPHPLQILVKIRKFMKSGAGLLVSVPNVNSTDRIWHGKNWFAWQLPVHLWHFDPVTIRNLLIKAGFTDVSIETGLFNPFDHIASGIHLGGLRKDAGSYQLKSNRSRNSFGKMLRFCGRVYSFIGNRIGIKSILTSRDMQVWATAP